MRHNYYYIQRSSAFYYDCFRNPKTGRRCGDTVGRGRKRLSTETCASSVSCVAMTCGGENTSRTLVNFITIALESRERECGWATREGGAENAQVRDTCALRAAEGRTQS